MFYTTKFVCILLKVELDLGGELRYLLGSPKFFS